MRKTITAVVLLLLMHVSSASAWWSVPANFPGSTHHRLTSSAQELAGTDYPDVVTKFGVQISNWTSGSTDDKRAHNENSDILPDSDLDPLLNGGPIRVWWDRALREYEQNHNFSAGDWSAYYYIALMTHLVEDQAVPAHAYNIMHGSLGFMDNMEQMANYNRLKGRAISFDGASASEKGTILSSVPWHFRRVEFVRRRSIHAQDVTVQMLPY